MSTSTDHILSLLAAERCGRAVTILQNPTPGSVWSLTATDTPHGHALLAAARLAARMGASVKVRLASPSDPSPIWNILADSAAKQNHLDPTPTPRPVTENKLTTQNPQGGPCELYPGQIPEPILAWRLTLGQSALFIREAQPDDPTLTREQCRAVDRKAMDVFGVPGLCLMENAAISATAAAVDMLHTHPGKTLIIAGGGNNGGDGLAMARGMWELGLPCEVALMKPSDSLSGDAAANLRLLRECTPTPIHEPAQSAAPEEDRLPEYLAGATLIVDALLGTGFSGKLSPESHRTVSAINASGLPVLSLDIPSGLDADTGAVTDITVHATRTVTFAALKKGLLTGEGAGQTGELFLADIGAPDAAYQ